MVVYVFSMFFSISCFNIMPFYVCLTCMFMVFCVCYCFLCVCVFLNVFICVFLYDGPRWTNILIIIVVENTCFSYINIHRKYKENHDDNAFLCFFCVMQCYCFLCVFHCVLCVVLNVFLWCSMCFGFCVLICFLKSICVFSMLSIVFCFSICFLWFSVFSCCCLWFLCVLYVFDSYHYA